ncbi:MAG: hypothetical protein LBC49_00615 [Bacteroidales bacterium]|jgi:hypothetical protein|nr:hypothetical protein [Bacteroidales bacterium]
MRKHILFATARAASKAAAKAIAKATVTAIVITTTLTTTLNAEIKYVKQDGSGSGTSWEDASNDLQTMIDNVLAGDSIFVAEGIYIPDKTPALYQPDPRSHTFYLKQGVAIFGGFENTGNPTISNRNPSVHITILSGDAGVPLDITDNLYHILVLEGSPNPTYPTM